MPAGKNLGSSSSTGPQSHQIFCCAFNANGTVFVTGSSDTLARVPSMILTSYLSCICVSLSCFTLYLVIYEGFIKSTLFVSRQNKIQPHIYGISSVKVVGYLQVWNACKPSMDDSDQPNHEIDVLSGHENDVNYVQFRLVCSAVLSNIASKM